MKATVLLVGLPLAILMVVLCAVASPPGKETATPATGPATRQVQIELDKAVLIAMPRITQDLKPISFQTPDHKDGWVVRLPGNRPIATPAYADGMLFVGGGYGSHEFYALDARSGQKLWEMKTADDGPTAAVVEDGCVAFNTESCTVIVVEAKTGKLLWQEWLGDPLMSQPAIFRGKLYIAYPGGSPQGVQMGNQRSRPQSVGPAKGKGHRLLCAELKTGKHLWEQDLTADVISAPVIEDGQIFLTCFDGTSFCLDPNSGQILWQKNNAATSAPLVAGGQVIITQKGRQAQQTVEGLKRVDIKGGQEMDQMLLAQGHAEYLASGKGNTGLSPAAQVALDSQVGFGGGAPAAAQMQAAAANVAVSSVAGGWAYQGSRASYSQGRILNAQGNALNGVRAADGQVLWRAEAQGKGLASGTQAFSPPALGGANLYLCSVQGHLLSVRQDDGAVRFCYATQVPMAFQPALAQGSMYIGSSNGLLTCLKTGDQDADGWSAWGGNAQHNKKD